MFKVEDEWRQGSYDDIGLPANMYEVKYFIDKKELFQILMNFPHCFTCLRSTSKVSSFFNWRRRFIPFLIFVGS